MSEFFFGITFPWQKVTPSDDASVRRSVLADGILSGCEISYVGSTLTMGAGLLIGCGRQFRHTTVQNFAVTGATSGYARLVITIDTTKASTKDAFEQIDTVIEYATAVDGFTQLRQDNINEAGTIYQMAVCVVSLSVGGISGILCKLGRNSIRIVLSAAGWTGRFQTIPVCIASYSNIFVAADPSSHDEYCEAGVRCVAHAAGSLTFMCIDVPKVPIAVNVAIMGIGDSDGSSNNPAIEPAMLFLENNENGYEVQAVVGEEVYGVSNATTNRGATEVNYDFTIL